MSKTIVVTVDLTEERAAALAQFVKRMTLSDFEGKCSPGEARDGYHYAMQSALLEVAKALAERGFSPR